MVIIEGFHYINKKSNTVCEMLMRPFFFFFFPLFHIPLKGNYLLNKCIQYGLTTFFMLGHTTTVCMLNLIKMSGIHLYYKITISIKKLLCLTHISISYIINVSFIVGLTVRLQKNTNKKANRFLKYKAMLLLMVFKRHNY